MRNSIAMIIAALLASGATSAMAADNPADTSGLTAGWRLHPEGSHFLNPQGAPKDIVWAIVFDTKHVHWNLVIIPQSGPPTFESFDNDLGATPAPISGSQHQTSASVVLGSGAFTVKSTHALGSIKESSSTCALSDDKKQMSCKGQITKSDGSTSDFEVIYDRM